MFVPAKFCSTGTMPLSFMGKIYSWTSWKCSVGSSTRYHSGVLAFTFIFILGSYPVRVHGIQVYFPCSCPCVVMELSRRFKPLGVPEIIVTRPYPGHLR